MSRSNPSDAIRNPSTRWFEFDGGATGGFVRYYDKEAEKTISLGDANTGSNFVFILLDELATVKGWHDASDSGIFANEVRDTRQDALVVQAFKGGELVSGLYASVKDRIASVGGNFVASCYIAYKDGDALKIGNIRFKGASLASWMEFKKKCPDKQDATGRKVRGYFVDAVRIKGFDQGKKGSITYRTPIFTLASLSEQTNADAVALDAELQTYLSEYLKRPRQQAAAQTAKDAAADEHGGSHQEHHDEPAPRRDIRGDARRETVDQDPPFSDEVEFAEADIPF